MPNSASGACAANTRFLMKPRSGSRSSCTPADACRQHAKERDRDMTPADMEPRIVRYGDLQPCKTAFIDAHTPGSDQKENFTIIGGGVSESADQHVHITIPHGFNIGAAGQPPKCRNSLHTHRTAEVFFVLKGRWRFFWGRWGDAGRGGAGRRRYLQHPHRHVPRVRKYRHRLRDDHGDSGRRRRRRRRDLGAAGDRGRPRARAGAGRQRQALRHQEGRRHCPMA